ncbi:ABC transporter ATP-binding protein [Amycolatopsis suaedae]|uniref:ABC transporter ATP-binding protein n=2 Tax=Amycolatopsis suaedae TaxID=2510978 RepID=A0A4Q7JAK6_9PSEU|nr:ABC transporter ATP-binding protein [Amycolatopsis suaedae]
MRYGPTDVLRGVDLRIDRGEVLALLGPNGAGKTTTVEILEGLRVRSAGHVRVLGTDPGTGGEAWRARLGIVLQAWNDHGRWRAGELLDHLRHFYTPYTTPYDTAELLDLVGLADQAGTRIAALSGGQRRRLDVAIGLAGRPELLFLDEPTVGFDPQARQEFHELITRLSAVDSTSILLTTHDLAEAEKLADRIVILAGGTVVAEGDAATLADRVAGNSRVRYRLDGEPVTHSCADATGYVRDLFARHGEHVTDLEVHRASLEDVYLAMVRDIESGLRTEAPADLMGANA